MAVSTAQDFTVKYTYFEIAVQITLKMVPLFWKWSSVGQIWSQIKKLIFLENGEGWGGASSAGFDRKTLTWT